MTRETLRQILLFGAIGAAGYVVDVAALYAAKPVLGPYGGRVASYLAAATFTYILNRRFTFAVRGRAHFFRQWATFLFANLGGGAVNYALYAGLTAFGPPPANLPFLAVGAGSLAGMAVNFTLSKRIVFAKGAANPLH